MLGPFDLACGRSRGTVRAEQGRGDDGRRSRSGRDPAPTWSCTCRPTRAAPRWPTSTGASTKPVAPDTARVLVAHTATVPPADVRVDGKVVFEDIANGEFAVADVPAGEHSAALVPAGTTGKPILGPLDVDLPAGTVTMVYAVGSPTNGSMNVITHQEQIPTARASELREIGTGSAGLVGAPGHDVRAMSRWPGRGGWSPPGRWSSRWGRSPARRVTGRWDRACRPAPTTAGGSLEARPARRAGPPEAERPVSVRLPSGTVVPVRSAGTRAGGVLDVPDDITQAGWWRAGARLGDPFGSTLIAGHVDAVDQGLGAFAELLDRASRGSGCGPVAAPGADLHDPVPAGSSLERGCADAAASTRSGARAA